MVIYSSFRQEQWEAAKVRSATVERIGTRGNIRERGPKQLTMERLSWVCHCHQMRNPHPHRPDNNTSTCAIKCRNIEGGVYEYNAIKRNVTCPSCLCNCTAAFEVSGGGAQNEYHLHLLTIKYLSLSIHYRSVLIRMCG